MDSNTKPTAAEPVDEATAVRPGDDLDWATVDAHLRTNLPELDGRAGPEVRQFPGGAANLTYLLRYEGLDLVLRRQPFGTIAPGAHDMRREHSVLSRLWRHFDRAPRAYLFCDDKSIAGADFFVMERREGVVVRDGIPPSMAHHENVAHRVSYALIDAMAEFHLLDPTACEVGDIGKPDGFMSRQVSGWKKRWDLVAGGDAAALMDRVHARLAETLPAAQRVSLVHNDLKLDNCQFHSSNPDRATSIFDWDMTTLGDPLADLGTLLNYWPDLSDGPDVPKVGSLQLRSLGLPSRVQITEHYAKRTGLDCSVAPWYVAFGKWKTGVVLMQLYRRWEKGDSRDERAGGMIDSVPPLAKTAAEILGL